MGENIIIKTKEQISGIRKSCQLSAQLLQYLGNKVCAGVTTEELDQAARKYIRDHQAIPAPLNYHGFPKSICTSVNNEICHGIPNRRELEEGDILSIDVSTILNGFFGDTCQTFPVGKIDYEAQRLVKITKECLKIGIKEVYPGNRFGNIGYKINKYATQMGYGVVYQYTGHGVGLDFHEDPSVMHVAPKNSGSVMKPRMIFTIEPMINTGSGDVVVDKQDKWTVRTKDGGLSAQFEHAILVTENGNEILTLV